MDLWQEVLHCLQGGVLRGIWYRQGKTKWRGGPFSWAWIGGKDPSPVHNMEGQTLLMGPNWSEGPFSWVQNGGGTLLLGLKWRGEPFSWAQNGGAGTSPGPINEKWMGKPINMRGTVFRLVTTNLGFCSLTVFSLYAKHGGKCRFLFAVSILQRCVVNPIQTYHSGLKHWPLGIPKLFEQVPTKDDIESPSPRQ